jgi:hypothetical protein
MTSGGFIPKDLFVEIREEIASERQPDGTFRTIYGEPIKRPVLFCDIGFCLSDGTCLMDQYYDQNHAVGRKVTELELQAIEGYRESFTAESAELYKKVFNRGGDK